MQSYHKFTVASKYIEACRSKAKKKEMYEIIGSKGHEITQNQQWVSFRVAAGSHTQHAPMSTRLNDLSASGLARIRQARADGFTLTVVVGGREVAVENE